MVHGGAVSTKAPMDCLHYLPKHAHLSVLKHSVLDVIAWQFNIRPRKTLGWICPVGLFLPNSFDYAAYYKASLRLLLETAVR